MCGSMCCWVGASQVKVAKPTAEQMVILDEQFGEKLKAKQKKEDDTINESTILHGQSMYINIPSILTSSGIGCSRYVCKY